MMLELLKLHETIRKEGLSRFETMEDFRCWVLQQIDEVNKWNTT